MAEFEPLYQCSRPEGTYQVQWDGTDGRGRQVASGIYFYRLETGKLGLSKKMVLLK